MKTSAQSKNRRVKGYPFDKVRARKELILKTYEYDLPFNFPNITVYRKDYDGGEFHGIELINHNDAFQVEKLGSVAPGQWVRMQFDVIVPPTAVEGAFRLDVASLAPNETLQIADAFAGIVPEGWNRHDPIPKGTENLLSNPGFTGGKMPPSGWELVREREGKLTSVAKRNSNGQAGLLLEGVQLMLRTTFGRIQPGQKLAFSLWVRANHPSPKTVWLIPQFKSSRRIYLSERLPDAIIVEEQHPIVRVAVIGSACTPPGYVMLEVEPTEEFYARGDFIRGSAPLRFRQDNLWGMHLRWDCYGDSTGRDYGLEPIPQGMIRRYPGSRNSSVRLDYSVFPLAGMSCAIFEIPKARKVTIMGGSANNSWMSDAAGPDNHYSFRTIRTTVAVNG